MHTHSLICTPGTAWTFCGSPLTPRKCWDPRGCWEKTTGFLLQLWHLIAQDTCFFLSTGKTWVFWWMCVPVNKPRVYTQILTGAWGTVCSQMWLASGWQCLFALETPQFQWVLGAADAFKHGGGDVCHSLPGKHTLCLSSSWYICMTKSSAFDFKTYTSTSLSTRVPPF